MVFIQNIEGCLEPAIGKAGLSQARLEHWLDELEPGFSALRNGAREGRLPLFRVLDETADIAAARRALTELLEGAETLIFFGTGGSSLGGQTLAQLGGWSSSSDHLTGRQARPRLRFFDNLDACSLAEGLAGPGLAAARFIVISKSGNTAETLIQTLTAFEYLKQAGLGALIPKLFLGVTEPEQAGQRNGLRQLLAAHGVPMLPHDPGIGGRYSAFTIVGMLPALACGLDAEALRRGGCLVVRALLAAKHPQDFPPAIGAALAVALNEETGVSNMVMMPYSDRLERFAHWYVQLWAESLGKSGQGTTPIAALGPRDQHSQLQLYLDGPRAHLMTLVRLGRSGPSDSPAISPELAGRAGAPYLAGHTAEGLVRAQGRAIADAFIRAGRPVRTFDAEQLDETALGGLMMHFMIETILAAHLWRVDPFDQPAVELGKQLARDYLASAAKGRETIARPPASNVPY